MGVRELTLEQSLKLARAEQQHRATEAAILAAVTAARRARAEAVKEALDAGVPVAQIARACGVQRPTVYEWRRSVE